MDAGQTAAKAHNGCRCGHCWAWGGADPHNGEFGQGGALDGREEVIFERVARRLRPITRLPIAFVRMMQRQLFEMLIVAKAAASAD